jgi:peptide-methionine (S)-S-oxide reductase
MQNRSRVACSLAAAVALAVGTWAGLQWAWTRQMENAIAGQRTIRFRGKATGPPIDRDAHADVERALFAVGCYWSAEGRFGALPGVVSTRVGYLVPVPPGAGKHVPRSPLATPLDEATEAVEVTYDPSAISYADLLGTFWAAHDPTQAAHKPKYQAVICPLDNDQRRHAEASMQEQATRHAKPIRTSISGPADFRPAPARDQKHRLQSDAQLMTAFARLFPDEESFLASTAATRANGFLSGYGTAAERAAQVPELGLPTALKHRLLGHAANGPRPGCAISPPPRAATDDGPGTTTARQNR